VLDNIIANSYKYAGTAIDVSAEITGGALILTVRDYGQGAAPEELPRLCSKYFRGKASEGKNGYGLGLFISRTLIERMGGHLECENASPGFTVRLRLPLDGA
jgi:signal transduction histidine kinase